MVSHAVVIIEVLSPSTKNYDRGQKFQYYRMLPSLREYLTIAQDEMHVERWTRQENGQWLLTEFNQASGPIELGPIGVALNVADIYRRVDFAEQ